MNKEAFDASPHGSVIDASATCPTKSIPPSTNPSTPGEHPVLASFAHY